MSTAPLLTPALRRKIGGPLSTGHRARWAWERADFRTRLLRAFCAVALGVLFWYSVPYGIPKTTTNGLQDAVTNASENFQGSASRQVAVPLIAALAVFMLWRFPRRGLWRGYLRWPVIGFVVWAAVSYGWSQAAPTTGKRLIVFFADVLFAYTLARVASLLEMAWWGFLSTFAVAMISLSIDIFHQHTFAPLDPDYRFMGVMEANYQAMNLVVSTVCAMTLVQRRPRWVRWLLPCMALELGLLFLTRSRLSTALALVLLTAMAMRWARDHWQSRTRAAALLGLLTVIVPGTILAIGSDPEGVARQAFMMGRTDTENTQSLSNRAPLWKELFENIATRPVLGFGYAAFWTPGRVDRISLDQGWAVPNAHDTYLDQWLSLGFFGMLLYCISLWGACVAAWRRDRRERTPESLFAAVLLTWLACESLAESVPLDPYLPGMLAYACLAKMCLWPGTEPAVVEFEPIVQGMPVETRLEARPA